MGTRPNAVSFDFYQTLAFHRDGRGRGVSVMDYLEQHGLESDPWEHQILYDIFARHREDYAPTMSPEARADYLAGLAERLFERLRVRGSGAAEDHAAALWALLGPTSLALFPETLDVLQRIRSAGIPAVVTSNWQAGLEHFCAELGILPLLHAVFVSAEVGFQKPDRRIFEHVCSELGLPPNRILHVGDSVVDDYDGATGAGLGVLVIDRDGAYAESDIPTIRSLDELLPLMGLA